MDSGRRRSSSFHTDYDDNTPLQVLPETLLPNPITDSEMETDPSAGIDACSRPDNASSAESEEESFENLIRTRSRSRSVHDYDGEENVSQHIIEHATKPKEVKVELKNEPKHELAGPIQPREVLALQKVCIITTDRLIVVVIVNDRIYRK